MRVTYLLTMAPWLLILAGDSALQQPMLQDPPTTVIAISWAIVLAEGFIIARLWRALGIERQRVNDMIEKYRLDSLGTIEALRTNTEATKDIRRAISSLDKRLSVHDDVKEMLRRMEE